MWIENPVILAIGAVMVVLFGLARLFPRQRWLDPFRPQDRLRPPRPSLEEYIAQHPGPAAGQQAGEHWSTAGDRPPVHFPTPRMAARRRAVRRFRRIETGFGLIFLGFVTLGGFAVMARMTGNDPAAEPLATLARTLAGICFVVGVLVLVVPRRRP